MVHEDIDPDLAVGLGAAVQAGLLKGASVGRILVDVAAHSLGIKIVGQDDDPDDDEGPDTFAPVLRRNTVLPAQRAEEFYTMALNQKLIEVEVFQGESDRCSENTRIGSFRFDLAPAPGRTPVRFDLPTTSMASSASRSRRPGPATRRLSRSRSPTPSPRQSHGRSPLNREGRR